MNTQRKWLITVWGIGFVIPLLLILIQGFLGKYGSTGENTEIVGWLTALTLPTILLMIGVMVGSPTTVESDEPLDETAKKKLEDKLAKEKTVFVWAISISILYLLIINIVFWIEPLVTSKPKIIMGQTKIYLALFDSLISILIGYFFGKK